MSALNFTVFIEKVEEGTKRQSIRATRKRPFRLGERLHLFAGMRTGGCRRLRAGCEDFCTQVREIVMDFKTSRDGRGIASFRLTIDGEAVLDFDFLGVLACCDGFPTPGDFLHYFWKSAKRLRGPHRRFTGQIVNW